MPVTLKSQSQDNFASISLILLYLVVTICQSEREKGLSPMSNWTWDYNVYAICIIAAIIFLAILIYNIACKKSKFVPAMGLFSSLFLMFGVAFVAVFPQVFPEFSGTSVNTSSALGVTSSKVAPSAMQAAAKNTKKTASAPSSETMLQFDARRANEQMNTAEVRFAEEAGTTAPPPANTQAATSSASTTSATPTSPSAPAKSSGGKGNVGNFNVSIQSVRRTKDYQGKDAVVVKYSWTNNSNATTSALASLLPYCYQDGIQLDPATLGDNDNHDLIQAEYKNVQPGKSLTCESAYLLSGKESKVDVNISDIASLGENKVTASFSI